MKKNYLGKVASLMLLAVCMTFNLTSCDEMLDEKDNPAPATPDVQEVVNTIAEVTGATPEAVTAALQDLVTDEAVAAAASNGEPIKVVVATDAGIASETADKTITIPQKNGANIEIVFDAVPTGTGSNELEFKAEGVADDAVSGDSQNQLAISMPEAASSANLSIVIDMPTTTVTLKSTGSTLYKSVTSKTANQTLILDEGVTINGRFYIEGGSVDATKGHVKGNIYLNKENMGEIHLALNPEDRPEYLNFMKKGNTLVFDTDLPNVNVIDNATGRPENVGPEDAKIAFNWFNVEDNNVFNWADLRWLNSLRNLTVAIYDDGETTPGKATLENVPLAKNTIFEPNQIEFRYPGNEFEDKGSGFNERNGRSVPDMTREGSETISKCTFNCAALDGTARFKAPYVQISIPDPFGNFRKSLTYTLDNCVFANPDENFNFCWIYPVPENAYDTEYPVTLVFKDCKFGDADFSIDSAFFNWMKNNLHEEMDKNVTYNIQIVNGETTKTYKLEKDGEDKCKFTEVL